MGKVNPKGRLSPPVWYRCWCGSEITHCNIVPDIDDTPIDERLPLRLRWVGEIADRNIFFDVIYFILSYLRTLNPGHRTFHGTVDCGRGLFR
jgi:hypothetical protein